MSIEIESRGVRWRSIARPLSVQTQADRRLHLARTTLLRGQSLRPVLPERRHQPSSVAVQDDSTGPPNSNLRADLPGEAFPLDAKD